MFKFIKGKLFAFVAILMLAMTSAETFAQVVLPEDPPDIELGLPFDVAPIIAGVLALAVTVMILIAGPRISLQFGATALRKIGGIFRG